MKFARTIRLDDSDENVFSRPAIVGEWAISGAFEFSDWNDSDLIGQKRQEFSNGWLGLETFGRASCVAVARITEREFEDLIEILSNHFVKFYGAPNVDVAKPVAEEEIKHMKSMCDDHSDNTLLVVSRELTDVGVHERFRFTTTQIASLDSFAVHGSVD